MSERESATQRSASLRGLTVGGSVVLLYLAAGLLSGVWNLGDFLSRLTLETAGWLLFVSSLGIATFAIPIALYLSVHLRSPLVLLIVIVLGWPIYGFLIGILTTETVFGLGLYAVGLAPLYIVLYLVLGGGEYYIRTRKSR